MDEDFHLSDEGLKPPRKSLETQIWCQMYRNLPVSSQITMLKDIMANLDISFIKAGDTDPSGRYVWMTNEPHRKEGSLSSAILVSLGYMHASYRLHEKCSTMMRILIIKGAVHLQDDVYVFRVGRFENSVETMNSLHSILGGCSCYVKIELNEIVQGMLVPGTRERPTLNREDTRLIKEILEDDELYEKFISTWNPDEKMEPMPPRKTAQEELREREQNMTQEERDLEIRENLIEDRLEEFRILADDMSAATCAIFVLELQLLIRKYRNLPILNWGPLDSTPSLEKDEKS